MLDILPKGVCTMPKELKKSNKPPKYSKVGKYAVIYQDRKPVYLPGLHGSPESKEPMPALKPNGGLMPGAEVSLFSRL